MNEEFVNAYIDSLNKKFEDVSRNETMLMARLMIAEKLIATLQSEKDDLVQQLEKFNSSLTLNKKALKKEENTF